MLRHALSELRLHPTRFVATLVAIAISVGFVAAISVFVNSQQSALGKQNALQISKADVVVAIDEYEWPEDGSDPLGAVDDVLGTVPGVTAALREPAGGVAMLTKGDRTATISLFETAPAELRWSKVLTGRLPEKPDELALSRGALAKLGAAVGDSLTVEADRPAWKIVGETDDPDTLWTTVGYVAPFAGEGFTTDRFIVAVDGDPAAAIPAIEEALKKDGWKATVETGDAARAETLTAMTADVDIFKYFLQGFGAIALLVGAITIANTFTILVTQRRRQLGLLRAVGASPAQVRGRIVVESFLIGAVGSLLGLGVGFAVAWGGGAVTGSNYFGLTVVPWELALAWLVGVLVTMVASLGPAVAASRVRPLEALQSVPTEAQAKRAGIVRAVVCGLFGAGGVFLATVALRGGDWALAWAIGAGVALTIAVLGAAPLYVAPLLGLLGKLFGAAGPTVRMAFVNSARNPRRAASTATALMLAVGLIVTLQAALATARSSGMATIEKEYPIDVVGVSHEVIPASLIDQLRGLGAVQNVAGIESKPVGADGASVIAPGAAYEDLGVERPNRSVPADGEIFLSNGSSMVADAAGFSGEVKSGMKITLQGSDGPIELTVKTSDSIDWSTGLVTAADFAKLTGEQSVTQVWLKLHDRTSSTQLNQVTAVLAAHPEISLNQSGAMMASALTQVMNVMLIVLTALLGVAVVIALVGVGNTLGLSVIERQRESALLRALGMQRAGLRVMLLVEALAMVGVGTAIGLIAGSFFGWLGVKAAIASMPEGIMELRFSLDPVYTGSLIGVCLLAAVLASILPGRRAANATPTEALAAE
ncbi:MAG: FtsX-like permease family protein [Tessaracoccus sp.]|uniref:ABC transporter permease n=1 Tax=Tessaracoccus sp. TaxID=1971211 RepID=UPI001EBE63CD|nr:FtsX-like permease family protein [Tessaracoccus sp.]MBK7819734.1 FtsX-like permease family protein [Tessaracoccus sp.]